MTADAINAEVTLTNPLLPNVSEVLIRDHKKKNNFKININSLQQLKPSLPGEVMSVTMGH